MPYEMKQVTAEEDKIVRKCLMGYTRPFMKCGENGYLMPGAFKKHAESIYNMEVRPDDVWVITFPRSGTTWIQELVWLAENDLDYITAKEKPLYKRFPMLEVSGVLPEVSFELIKINFFNLGNFQGLGDAVREASWKTIDKAPSPRFIKTHLPLSMLPPKLLSTAKVVYVARDPRDVLVSFYYLHKMTTKKLLRANVTHFWEAFRRDLLPWTPVVAHANEAFVKRHHPNLHFVFYENMKKDLFNEVKGVCNFLGKDYSDVQLKKLTEHLTFDSLKKNKNVNNSIDKIQFIRKGEAGGWRAHFDEKMQLQADEFLSERLRGLQLRYPSFPLHDITRL